MSIIEFELQAERKRNQELLLELEHVNIAMAEEHKDTYPFFQLAATPSLLPRVACWLLCILLVCVVGSSRGRTIVMSPSLTWGGGYCD